MPRQQSAQKNSGVLKQAKQEAKQRERDEAVARRKAEREGGGKDLGDPAPAALDQDDAPKD